MKINAKIHKLYNNENSKVKAFASIYVDDAIAIHGVRVVQGDKGLFTAMPQYKSSNGEYKDYCHAVNAEVRGQINNSVIETYNKELSLQEESEPELIQSI